MGLTRSSVGIDVASELTYYKKNNSNEKVIALAGSPNVGKSSIFNLITGLHQHTGNWTGKTVQTASGTVTYNGCKYTFVDLPGCYSLKSKSKEEEVARDFLCSNIADLTIVVCDATMLERNLNLVLQIKEITENVIVCINLMDEAEKMNIRIDVNRLSVLLDSTVITTIAHDKSCRKIVLNAVSNHKSISSENYVPFLTYPDYIEGILKVFSEQYNGTACQNRINALSDLENNKLNIYGKTPQEINDDIIYTILKKAKQISTECIKKGNSKLFDKQYKIDKILTGKFFGFFTMILLLLVVFWITIIGANYPSELLNKLFLSLEKHIYNAMTYVKIPPLICDMTVNGVYHILTKIISVMLPPMAIFFPLFTFLEDLGYLPRIAFNLDKCFKKCSACGKQALTMCMGFGCNAAGVVGTKIIDSPREQLIAVITNCFVPCNGRFPAIISIITMFFVSNTGGIIHSLLCAVFLTLFILIGIFMTLLVSKTLSRTVLKGVPSFFILELPHYRKPQMLKIIVRSIFDRTLFVLGRAICVAAPAGLIIWIFANINLADGVSILSHISSFFDPFGKILGLDGVIITAFILGFPANEIVIPLIFMMYMSQGTIADIGDISSLKSILVENGWTYITAVNTILFMMMHWPCSTTCLTIKAETKSVKWTIVSILIPTLCGIGLCILSNLILNSISFLL